LLESLHISNYALIESLDLRLDEGFSVITGETGAGKSIILGALGLLQGNRADIKVIKGDAKKCVVEGIFTAEGLGVREILEAEEIDCDDETIIVRREIAASGKSRTFINDTPVTLNVLREVSERLIDIHSQHQNLLLSHETFIIDTLDCVSQSPIIYKEYTEAFDKWREANRKLQEMKDAAARSQADQDFIAFQLSQLAEANLQDGELEELEEEQQTLAHAEDIKSALYGASGALQNDENDVLSALKQACNALLEAGEYLPAASELAERLESSRIEIDDIFNEIEDEAEHVEFDPRRLEFVDDRIAVITTLLKKHRVESVAELLQIQADLQAKIDIIENADDNIARQEALVNTAFKKLSAAGEKLTKSRKNAADEVVKALITSMQGLGMPNVKIVFEFSLRNHPDRSGLDNVRFLFSANKSVAPQDIAQTASGGEIARLMLALKALIAQKKNLPTIIFDEIDTGVSGTMAERMGQVMEKVGQHAQVLCITHLPQIAALGSHHFRVYKKEDETGTVSHIIPLDNDERIREIANMLSGERLTPEALANAKILLRL